ncbi:mitochondrial import inner membrane translocase subunit TIM50-like [Ornithodoros turicata]|uniref:mitochondrial import inner membrane translocase subunit TIM50-like n=1 Tax=Ornithodoros turicata TaxID=34597 RepID=UPI0031397EF4
MALRNASMCLCRSTSNFARSSRLVSSFSKFDAARWKKTLQTNSFACFYGGHTQTIARYSVSSTSGSGPGLADSVLKQKIASEKGSKESANVPPDDQEKKKSDEFSKRAMKYTFIAFGAMFTGTAGFLILEWGKQPVDADGNKIEDEFSHMPSWKAHIYRAYREVANYNKMIKDPSREKLLPDPLTEPYYQPPYTLVLEMTGILVHPDWTYQTGWRFKKRPGVNFFLQQVGPPLFEVVIYTSEQGFTAYPILDTLDPQGYIMYRLFRDATRYMDGHHVKDLSCLNRDLSKVILVDWNKDSFRLNPSNALRLKKWEGNDDDRTLVDLAVFLRTVATSNVEDVRTVLEYYSEFDDPLEAFRENQRKLEEERQRMDQVQQATQDRSTLAKPWSERLWRRR